MDLKINFPKERIKKVQKSLKNFWISKNIWIFLFVWIGLAIFVFWIWISYVHRYKWSEEKTQSYLNEKGKGITLNEKKQNNILEDMSERDNIFENVDKLKIKDIFGIE